MYPRRQGGAYGVRGANGGRGKGEYMIEEGGTGGGGVGGEGAYTGGQRVSARTGEGAGGPLLPCGHPYITRGAGGAILTCPVCRVTHHHPYPVYQHLSPPAHTTYTQAGIPPQPAPQTVDVDIQQTAPCPFHGDPLRLWCEDCGETACGLCMFDRHPKEDHNLTLITQMHKSRQDFILTNSHKMLRQTSRLIAKNEADFSRLEARLLRMFQKQGSLHLLHHRLSNVTAAALSSTSLSGLLQAERQLKSLQAEAWKKGLSGVADDEDEAAVSAQRLTSGEAVAGATQRLGLHLCRQDGRQGRLVWDLERLLLCTFTHPSPQPHHVLQLVAVESLAAAPYPEAFLELSVEGATAPLGYVYIRLQGHLRRAQNFLALCLGTLGPSFLGSRLISATTDNRNTKSVTAGRYMSNSSTWSTTPLLTALEWGGSYQTALKEGIVVASSGGAPENDCLYDIITDDEGGGGLCQCVFGEVVDGLDVVREAAVYHSIEQVFISQCGLVLPQNS